MQAYKDILNFFLDPTEKSYSNLTNHEQSQVWRLLLTIERVQNIAADMPPLTMEGILTDPEMLGPLSPEIMKELLEMQLKITNRSQKMSSPSTPIENEPGKT